MEIPPHDEDFKGEVSTVKALDAIIKTLEDFKIRAGFINILEFDSSMFHMNLKIKLDKK